MKLSAKTEYACLAMLELAAEFATGEPVRIRAIADEHGIPQRFLVQILLQLKGAGLVTSTRGSSGGYQLVRPPDQINLGEIVSVIEGPTDITSNLKPDGSPLTAALLGVWRELADVEQALLDEATLADLVERSQGSAENMYYI
jgi:Rrf2 family protein